MKKIISLILLLAMIISLSACGNKSLTMQDIYDAHQLKAMLAAHDSVSIKAMEDGESYMEYYMNADLSYEQAGAWSMCMTDDSCYSCMDGVYNRIVYIDANGLADLASLRAEKYASTILSPTTLEEEVKSVEKTNDRITVTSVMNKDKLAAMGEGISSCKLEYVLDAKKLSPISAKTHYTYENGTAADADIKFEYDTEMPEGIKPLLELIQQTDNLRTVTLVFQAGTEKENTVTVHAPKEIGIGLTSAAGTIDEYEMYADADYTVPYTFKDNISDSTVYIKWLE